MIENPQYSIKDVEGYEGLYAITSCGKVWSYAKEKFIYQGTNGTSPYLIVTLWKDGKKKNKRVHRLVANAYIPNSDPKTLKEVDHINGNPLDNYVGNLQWADSTINYCNRKNNIPVHDIITGEDYCSLSRAVKGTGIKRRRIVKDCEHYKETGEARRFVYLKELSWEEYNFFMKSFFEKHYMKKGA